MPSPLVLVVDDDAFTLSMITGSIATSGFIAHGEQTASKGFEFSKLNKPIVTVIDLDLGDGPTGIDLAQALRRMNPRIGIIFLTSYEDPRLHRPNLPNLPIGSKYLVKQKISEISELINMIRQVAEHPLGSDKESDTRLDEFTDVQIETLRLVAKGYSNSEIAKLRFVTEKTVEQTITRLAKQLSIAQTSTSNSRVNLARTYFNRTGRSIESE